MSGLLERLFGPRPSALNYWEGPTLAGLDPVSARAIALQKEYWSPSADELRELEGRGRGALSWPDKLRLHHLRCLALLDADDARLRRALLAPQQQRPREQLDEGLARARVEASAKQLLEPRSPFRPRHGFVWCGAGPPEGDAIPYSDFQGRTVAAALTHLGSLEVIELDERLEPARVAFVPFDEIMTLSRGLLADASAAFVPARILREYGLPELIVLLPLWHGLTWFAHEGALLRGEVHHEVAAIELSGLANPQSTDKRGDRRALGIGAGPQRLEVLSDYAHGLSREGPADAGRDHEGLSGFELGSAYQLSLAIDQDDPRFVDKCVGRGLDPEATRGDVIREVRLRASAKAARKRE